MKILTWNLACLPKNINFFRNPHNVIDKIIDTLLEKNADVIFLQEVFDKDIETKIKNRFMKYNYNFDSVTDYKQMSSNGLVTLTKYQIENTDLYEFENYTSVEYFIKKGILVTKTKNPDLFLFNTHIQSDGLNIMYYRCKTMRTLQYKEFSEYVNELPETSKVVLGGDYNEDLNEENFKDFVKDVKFKLTVNKDKMITFPYEKRQLDYIMANFGKQSFDVHQSELSDHYLFESNLK